jgi:hypothetical protein
MSSSPSYNPKTNPFSYNKHILVSEWLLFNANSAIFQLYHEKNKLIFNEMMMRSTLYQINMLSWLFTVLAHWNNSLQIATSPHLDTLYRFLANVDTSLHSDTLYWFLVNVDTSLHSDTLYWFLANVDTSLHSDTLYWFLANVETSLHSDTLYWFLANQSLLFLHNAVCLAKKQQISIS